MSKFEKLWEYVSTRKDDRFKLTFAEVEKAAGLPIDHSFLKFKKELTAYGWEVAKISMKEQTVLFQRQK